MSLFSIFKKHNDPPTFDVMIKPEILVDLKEALNASNKSVVRVDVVSFS